MLKRKDIKNETIVFDCDNENYHIISDVGNAMEKGDRGESTTPNDELSYIITNILTKEVNDGICEHSHMTSYTLSVAINKDVEIYFNMLEADAYMQVGFAKKNYAAVQDAINRFNKIK